MAEAGVAGAEVVHGDPDAEVAQLLQLPEHAAARGEHLRLGDLHGQRRARHARGGQGLAHRGDEVAADQLLHGDVDADQVLLGPGTYRSLPQRLAQHPGPDLDHAAARLQRRQERRRQQHAPFRVAPAQQHLVTDDATQPQVVDRLGVQLELVLVDGALQVGLQRGQVEHLAAVPVGEDRVHRLAGVLGGVHGDVGVAHHGVGVGLTGSAEDHADARAQRDRVAVHDQGRRQGARDPVVHEPPLPLVGAALQHQHELIAAQAGHRVAVADAAGQPGGHLPQHLVAVGVTAGVVDGLEAVQVEERDRHGPAVAVHPVQGVLDAVAQQHPVRQPRERVVGGGVQQPQLVPAGAGDVAEGAQDPVGVDGHDDVLVHPGPVPVRCDLDHQSLRLLGAEGLQERRVQARLLGLGEEAEDRPAGERVHPVRPRAGPVDPDQDRVDHLAGGVAVGGEDGDAVGAGLQRGVEDGPLGLDRGQQLVGHQCFLGLALDVVGVHHHVRLRAGAGTGRRGDHVPLQPGPALAADGAREPAREHPTVATHLPRGELHEGEVAVLRRDELEACPTHQRVR